MEEGECPAKPINRLERLQMEIEELCQHSKNQEVSEHELQEHFLDFSSDELKISVENLVKAMKVQVCMDEQRHTFIRLRDPLITRKLVGMEQDEVRVYEAIEAVGSRGISSRIIHLKTKVSNIKMAKMLTSLESKQLVKSVKLQKNSQHVKSYVLFHLKLDDPSNTHQTVFGSGAAFDAPLFDMVSKLCAVFLKQKLKKAGGGFTTSQATVDEILTGVVESGAVKADLTEDSIAAVMKMLELNGKVEKRTHIEEEGVYVKYRLHYIKSDKPEITIPCQACPVKHMCDINSSVNPMNCPHFETWWRKVDF